MRTYIKCRPCARSCCRVFCCFCSSTSLSFRSRQTGQLCLTFDAMSSLFSSFLFLCRYFVHVVSARMDKFKLSTENKRNQSQEKQNEKKTNRARQRENKRAKSFGNRCLFQLTMVHEITHDMSSVESQWHAIAMDIRLVYVLDANDCSCARDIGHYRSRLNSSYDEWKLSMT
jgi:hypothetical protein